ncbi:unnamed protein product [Rhizophagus irregularis]|nr:unnamed protein product [Rhizophagus irregularis]
MNVVRKHEDKSKKRKAKKNKKKKHQSVDSDSDPLTNDESDDYMRNTVDDDDQIGDDQDFEGNDDPVWTTDLGGIPVRWFPARWTLKERKQREKFQATI